MLKFKEISVFSVLFASLVVASSPLHGAKYAGEFLDLGVGARPLGMGSAYVALVDDVTSTYWNPAGLADLRSKEIMFMHAETFGDLLNHDYLGFALPLSGAQATLGASLIYLGGGGIKLTDLDYSSPNNRSPYGYVFRQVGEESHGDYTLHFSYARRAGAKLSWGGGAKIVYRKIAGYSGTGLGVDVGLKYRPRRWLSLGARLADATSTYLSYSTGEKESVLPSLRLGGALSGSHGSFDFVGALDSHLFLEGRDYASQLSWGGLSADIYVGGEVGFRDTVWGRLGSERGHLTAGGGIRYKNLLVDFAFLSHDQLEDSYRVSLKLNL
jgi:hypothetical protein